MITAAIQRGNYVYVYGEGGHSLFSSFGELQGYTSGSVSVRRGDYIYVYNEKGGLISSYFSPIK